MMILELNNALSNIELLLTVFVGIFYATLTNTCFNQ